MPTVTSESGDEDVGTLAVGDEDAVPLSRLRDRASSDIHL